MAIEFDKESEIRPRFSIYFDEIEGSDLYRISSYLSSAFLNLTFIYVEKTIYETRIATDRSPRDNFDNSALHQISDVSRILNSPWHAVVD